MTDASLRAQVLVGTLKLDDTGFSAASTAATYWVGETIHRADHLATLLRDSPYPASA